MAERELPIKEELPHGVLRTTPLGAENPIELIGAENGGSVDQLEPLPSVAIHKQAAQEDSEGYVALSAPSTTNPSAVGPSKVPAERRLRTSQKVGYASQTDREAVFSGRRSYAESIFLSPLVRAFSPFSKEKKNHPQIRLNAIRVRSGDTLEQIAFRYGLTILELQRLNELQTDSLFEGDLLQVPKGKIHIPKAPDIRPGFRRSYRPLFPRKWKDLVEAKPEAVHKNEGRWHRGPKGFHAFLGQLHTFWPPISGGFITSPFGPRWGSFHSGVDIAADEGTPIHAAKNGKVVHAGEMGVYGNLVTIAHSRGLSTNYAHCSAIDVKVGQAVKKGQIVAAVGTTGRSTGPHLHFEVRKNGRPVDPFSWCIL